MILSIARYTPRIALRIKNTMNLGQLTDWKKLQLIIQSPPLRKGCHVGGSPWYLTGCWPFHPTNVDLANPKLPDFPAIAIDAFDTDDYGRVVFLLDDRVHNLPNGRYSGTIRVRPLVAPINIPAARMMVPFGQLGAASCYNEDRYRTPCDTPPPVLLEPEPVCDLYSFDIDLGPECAQHMVDQAVASVAREDCGDSGEFCSTCGIGDEENPIKETNCGFEQDFC